MLNTNIGIAKIYSNHIEKPEKAFSVLFDRGWHTDAVGFIYQPEKDVEVTVLAQTEQGALKVAAYHYYSTGRNFRIKS